MLVAVTHFIHLFFRYIMVIKVADATGEAWLSVFNEQAEKIIGCSADELNQIKSEVNIALNQISLLV